ncbi:hypothetical protein N7457_004651 [Penicillium paradoxum]|uniref:uncharacterized protein n=1 Tax=Penicillium paradoxum TaxID=176176 RepID=UPI002549B111|nr:uncharacterized protein N7457_004651 [Penicillium paradoxum]KAJ5782877.1 hypothetical protein N7457_004651 [Penicillium paradoxum]
MGFSRLLLSALATAHIGASYLVAPSGTAFPGASSDCSRWVYGTSSLTCGAIQSENGITLEQFATWNPDLFQLSNTCALISGFYYCVEVDFKSTIPRTTSLSSTTFVTSTTATGSSSTTWGNGLITPSPIQTGMTDICYVYHFVVSGETCGAIASEAEIALTEFYKWNPAVGTDCTNLIAGDYVCIKILGYGISVSVVPTPSPTSFTSSSAVVTATTSTTSIGNGITTPSPIQTGMVATCDKFYLVVSGDTCSAIAQNENIPLADFYAWNPAVGSSCASLGLGDYVCVGILGATATPTPTGNGITTPTPIQTGMVSNCDEFYYVVSGDGCSSIATSQKLTVAEIEEWNPAIGTDCTSLWLDTYICVGVL